MTMKVFGFACTAIVAALTPVAALADDPMDPVMRSAAARERDREIIRGLNQRELARVRERDAGYAAGWRTWREPSADAGYAARSADHRRALDAYERDRAQYDSQVAAWRSAVAACRAGDYAACDR
jgi:hypothetical protein